jgi:hypothetical protein
MAPMLNPHINNTLFFGSVSPLWCYVLLMYYLCITNEVCDVHQTEAYNQTAAC